MIFGGVHNSGASDLVSHYFDLQENTTEKNNVFLRPAQGVSRLHLFSSMGYSVCIPTCSTYSKRGQMGWVKTMWEGQAPILLYTGWRGQRFMKTHHLAQYVGFFGGWVCFLIFFLGGRSYTANYRGTDNSMIGWWSLYTLLDGVRYFSFLFFFLFLVFLASLAFA